MKRTYKSIKGTGDATDALETGRQKVEVEGDFSGATDLVAMKRMQMAERRAAEGNSVYDSAQKGLLILD